MKYLKFRPSACLSPYINFYSYTRCYCEETGHYYRPIPSGCIELIIHLKNSEINFFGNNNQNNTRHKSYIVGIFPLKINHYIVPVGQPDFISVVFTPNGFYSLFKLLPAEFTSKLIDLDLVFGYYINILIDSVNSCRNIKQQIKTIDSFMLRFIPERKNYHSEVNELINIINNFYGNISLSGICSRFSIHPRTIEKQFKSEIGITPKEFCSINRFNFLLSLLNSNNSINWHDIIVKCGYYDQPHLINEFNKVLNFSPDLFLKTKKNLIHFSNRAYIDFGAKVKKMA